MTPVPLRLKRVPAQRGLWWLRQGVRAFMRRPLPYAALFATFLFGVLLLSLLPLIGPLAMFGAMPLVTLGFMLATRTVLQDQSPTPALFFLPLRADAARRRALIGLGVAYAIGSLAVTVLAGWIDGGSAAALQEAMTARDTTSAQIEAQLSDPQLQAGVLVRLVLTGLLAVPFWHASALVWWGGQGIAQSMFSSTLAVWRARGAFAMYLLGWAGMLGLFSMLLALIGGLLGGSGLVGAAAMPAVLLFSTIFYASLYFTFADSFEQAPPAPTPAPATATPELPPRDDDDDRPAI